MQGSFFWHELMTSDPAAAATFYGAVLGWEAKPFAHATPDGMPYTLFHVAGAAAATAGMMELTAEMKAGNIPPNWGGYVKVDDVDAKAAEYAGEGGTVHVPPTDIPNVGRFAVVADPDGAYLNIMTPAPMDDAPEMPKAPTKGTVGWNELYAGDPERAFSFYSKLFGWQRGMGVDMGPLGTYQLFGLGGSDIGGMMKKMPDMPMAFWNFYFCVEAIDAAIERVKAGGGTLVNGPHQVPGGSYIAQCIDPQGAFFSLTSMVK